MALSTSDHPAYAAQCGDPSKASKLGFGLRPAVLLLDVCRVYTSPSYPICLPVPTITRVTGAISSILHAARTSKVRSTADRGEDDLPVIFAQTQYTHASLRDAGLQVLKTSHAPLFHVHNPENQLALPEEYPGTHPAPNDILLKKKYPSPFWGTNLAAQLTALGADTLIIGGFTTSGSVRSAALDAMQAGFRAMTVAEACGDVGDETHYATLMDLNAKYGDVVAVEEAVEVLKQGWRWE